MRGLMRRTAIVAGVVTVVVSAAMGIAATSGTSAAGSDFASARAAVTGLAYVTNSGSNKVSVMKKTIRVGNAPFGVAVSPDGRHAYVTNSHSHTVSVIDTAANTVTKHIPVGNAPVGVAVSPDGRHAYVTNSSSNTVSVIGTATNTVTATVSVGAGPWGVAVTPDGKRVYVTNTLSNTVSVIDTATNKVATIPGFSAPWGVAVTPDGKRVYVANALSNTVSVIDSATNKVATIPVGSFPYGVAVSPDGRHVYVTNTFSHTVSVIGTASSTVVASVNVGAHPHGVAVSPDGKRVYVANAWSNTVSVIDSATNKVATISGFTTPENVAISAFVAPRVFAGYADTLHTSTTHPRPWQGSRDVIFLGCKYFTPSRCHTSSSGSARYDAGALRLYNPSPQAITVTSASVRIGPGRFDPWPGLHVRVPGYRTLILTQTGRARGNFNFDTSDTNHTNTKCTTNDKLIPVIHLTVNGRVLAYEDTHQILNTGGRDGGRVVCGSHDETRNWALASLSSASLPARAGPR